MPVQVYVLGPDRFARQGLAGALGRHPDLEVIGDGPLEGAAAQLALAEPDVAIVDLGDARPDEAALRTVPGVVLVNGDAAPSLAAGARGVLARAEADADRLAAAVRAVHHGLLVVDDGLGGSLLRAAAPRTPGGETMSPRELEVLELLALGWSNREIAAQLQISAHTAKFHVGSILEKLGAETRTEAVVLAARLGLLVL